MQTRRPRERPETLPLIVQRGYQQEVVQVSRSDYPLYLPTPLFPEPGIVVSRRPVRGVFTNMAMLHIAGPTFKDCSERYPGATGVGVRADFAPEDFARAIAKIAFGAAVYSLGLRPFTDTPIRNVILGSDLNIGHWVGGWHGEDDVNEAKGLHGIQVRARGTEIHVFIRLFAQFRAPEYHVVLGPAAPEFVASDAWPKGWRVPAFRDVGSSIG